TADEDGADALTLPHHRRNDARLHAGGSRSLTESPWNVLGVLDVRIMQHGAAGDRQRSAGLAVGHYRVYPLKFLPGRTMVRHGVYAVVLRDEIDCDHLAGEQALAARQDLVEHRLGVGDGAGNRAEHLG